MADARKSLADLLKSLGESSQFICTWTLPPVLPGLEVNEVGTIGSPISVADAKRLISKATQAPYGLGERTIVDTSVRRVWQIEPTEFRLENSEWDAHIAGVANAIQEDFGVQQKVRAELYKLLIYEPGSFFAPHRDAEKTNQMFATLVVCLPSRHERGALIVRHDEQTERIDFDANETQFKTQYAAFYADCEHEIEPVKSGHRICLIYNWRPSASGSRRRLRMPRLSTRRRTCSVRCSRIRRANWTKLPFLSSTSTPRQASIPRTSKPPTALGRMF